MAPSAAAAGRGRLARWGLACGLASPLLWGLAVVGLAALRPDFSHAQHYISELAARGTSTEWPMRLGGFMATGVLNLVFAATLLRLRGGPADLGVALLIALDGVGRIGAGVFPCDAGCEPAFPSTSQVLHGEFARLGFLSMVMAAAACGLSRRAERGFSRYSLLTALLALVALVMVTRSGRGHWVGFWESLASATLSCWLGVLAWRSGGWPWRAA